MPAVQTATSDLDACITRAEILALNGDAHAQKELVVSELAKVKQKFLARVNEHRVCLQMSIGFFQNLHRLEEMIGQAEKKYGESGEAESLMKRHLGERESLVKLFNFTMAEGGEIVGRVSAVGGSERAGGVRRLVGRVGEMRRAWQAMWEERERALRRGVESGQIMAEKGQISRDLDLLMNEIEHRRKNTGGTFEQVERNAENFRDITENMAVSGRFVSWGLEMLEKRKILLKTLF